MPLIVREMIMEAASGDTTILSGWSAHNEGFPGQPSALDNEMWLNAQFGKSAGGFCGFWYSYWKLCGQLSFTDNRFPMYLAILGGCLCFITYREQEWGVRVWIINGYGSEESRESLFRIRGYLMDGVLLQPLAYSQNGGEVLLLYHWTLVWYDLLTRFTYPWWRTIPY